MGGSDITQHGQASVEPTRVCPKCGQPMIRMWHDWRSGKSSWRCDNGHVQFYGATVSRDTASEGE